MNGCTRSEYRQEADAEAYLAIAERNGDPRWRTEDFSIQLDPRSRYFDNYSADCPPMPEDDPASHSYMHEVDGKRGFEHWHDNGNRIGIENPAWRESLYGYVDTTDDGAIKLSTDSAIKLAYIHSPNNQRQLETLYLTALDLTAERFFLDTQYFGGYDARYGHNGSLIPSALRFIPSLGRFAINPPINGPGVEQNRLTVGRPFGADPAVTASRRFATAGELLVGFANSFVFEFTGGDANLSTSLANFSFIQPLLRGAGRDVALEGLTQEERTLLANLRAYGQFRQGFYTQVAIGELGVTGPQRNGIGTDLQSFSGQGFVGGFVGLLQQIQQINNSEDTLSLQLRTRAQLETRLKVGVIDLVQVDQFRQSVATQEAQLLLQRNNLELALDRYKAQILGLPPDLSVDLDKSLIQQFQLVSRDAGDIQDQIVALQVRMGDLPKVPEMASLEELIVEIKPLIEPIRQQMDAVHVDLNRMDEIVARRDTDMTEIDRQALRTDREQLGATLADLALSFGEAEVQLQSLEEGLTEATRESSCNDLVVWLGDTLRIVEQFVLVQARARLESVTVEAIDMDPEDAFQIALANRLDFMNGRAALVDSWRQIQVTSDALQSVLNITSSGNIRTARNNPVSFRAPTSTFRLGLEFDAPLTRVLERNAYRESLIQYQRNRRAFIQSRDSLQLGIRALLRSIEQLRQNLEIQRRAVTIAIRRVDLTQAELSAPRPRVDIGRIENSFNPTTVINLLSAQNSLRDSQNSFLNAWINYYAARMRLARELGVMTIAPDGLWIELPLPTISEPGNESDLYDPAVPPAPAVDDDGPQLMPVPPAPPAIPTSWYELLEYLEENGADADRFIQQINHSVDQKQSENQAQSGVKDVELRQRIEELSENAEEQVGEDGSSNTDSPDSQIETPETQAEKRQDVPVEDRDQPLKESAEPQGVSDERNRK